MVFWGISFTVFSLSLPVHSQICSWLFLLFRRRAERARNRRRSRILMTMLLVFVFSWLPLNIINLLEDLELEVRLSLSQLEISKWTIKGALLAVVRLCILLLPPGKVTSNLKHNSKCSFVESMGYPCHQFLCMSHVQCTSSVKGCDGIYMLQSIPLLMAQWKLQVLLSLNCFNVLCWFSL